MASNLKDSYIMAKMAKEFLDGRTGNINYDDALRASVIAEYRKRIAHNPFATDGTDDEVWEAFRANTLMNP